MFQSFGMRNHISKRGILLTLSFVASCFNGFAQTTKADSTYRAINHVDVMPTFKDDLSRFLSKNLRYPDEAREAGATGKVVITFTIVRDGTIKDVHVFRSSGDSSLDNEALRVINLMDKKRCWNPAIKDNTPVDAPFTLPITYALEESNIFRHKKHKL